MRQFFLDAWENIKQGFIAMWVSFTPVVKTAIVSSCTGFLFGVALTLAFLC